MFEKQEARALSCNSIHFLLETSIADSGICVIRGTAARSVLGVCGGGGGVFCWKVIFLSRLDTLSESWKIR